ncbi:MAG TPA: hypothetical protein DC017_16310 [Candidatus Wallbacteria bacterium]|nr:hypothetical protein [Candidatus Wallbacteria bacterium]
MFKKSSSLSLSSLFSLPFSLLLIAFISFNSAAVIFCGAAAAADSVYSRNGEVYVMIGEGTRMGVYASQKIDANGNRVTIRPDGIKLFGDPTKMDSYQSIAVDQFRNVYVLAGKFDAGLQTVRNITPAGSLYVPVDPPVGCGIAGIGRDAGGNVYYDVLNYLSKNSGADIAHLHGAELFWNETMIWSGRNRSISSDYHPTAGTYGSGRRAGTFVNEAQAPPATTQGFNFVTGAAENVNTNYSAKYPAATAAKIRRMPEDVWFPGDYDKWNNIQYVGGHEGMKRGKMYIHYDFKIQRVFLWISHYVQNVPAGVSLPPTIVAGQVNDMFEQVFNTTNMKYKFMRHSGCESGHRGDQRETEAGVNTDSRLAFSTTGAGRRYVYSSLPTPKIRKGTIQLTAGNTFGIPQVDSADFTALHATQPLTSATVGIGAATKNANEDYVYTAPLSAEGMDVISFAVADQWDGTGGVRYMLLQTAGAVGKKFDPAREKKLRWEKLNQYAVNSNKSGTIALKKDVKAIAGDGSGSVYYLTDPRPVFDNAAGGDTFHSDASSPTDLKPLLTPGKPDGPFLQDGANVWKWYRKFSGRAATELYQIEYYTKTETKLNDFTVGNEDAIVSETFSDANGQNLISRGMPQVIPPGVSSIKLALATVNLAGPPTGNNEKMCVDIMSSNVGAANRKIKDITYSNRDSGNLAEAKIEGDEIAEDTQFRCYMENAPPKFSDDLVRKNIISGLVLKDENANGVIGGFDYAVRPGTACYYWRVEMIEPMKKSLAPDIGFTTSTNPVRNVTLTKVTAPPNSWGGLAGKGTRANNVNLGDGYWYSSRGANADTTAAAENAGAIEAAPDFAFTPKEPGIYKVSMIASAKKWNYGVLGYPSYITDRETAAGCKDNTTHYLFFDNGEGGGTAGNGVKDGAEDYVSERYIIVTAKQPEPDKYITRVKIEGPSTINENQIGIWKATANVRFVKSFNHETGTPSAKLLMETYNGIGAWDYSDTAVADWGLGPFDGVGEDYSTGAPARPSNSKKTGANTVVEPMMRNFGEKAPGSTAFGAAPPELAGVPPNIIFGTPPSFPSWVVGAGTSASPTTQLSKADRGCIEYEWHLAAEEKKPDGSKIFHGTAIDASVTSPSDLKRCPSIIIAKGRLSDEKPFPGDGSNKAVTWSNYANTDRRFDVTVNLRYAFDMPLDPGRYFLYIIFKYPKVKWEGRSPKKDKDGNLVKDAQGKQIFAYHDLVGDGVGETFYHTDNWLTINSNTQEPAGYAITVKDLQPPQAFFSSDNYPTNPSQTTALSSALPATGVAYDGGTTGDPFPGLIKYSVCDNNPNLAVTSSLMAMTGSRAKLLAWNNFDASKGLAETEDVYLEFNKTKVQMALEKTIAPKAAGRPPGTVQDAVQIGVNEYPGYGIDAPYRRAIYKLNNPKNAFTKDHIPYDMIGTIPLYAAGSDGSGNKMSDFDKDPAPNKAYNEILNLVNSGTTSTISEKQFPNAPAVISIIDNDAPSLRFYALRSRDNIYREYIMTSTGNPDLADSSKPLDHDANHDELDWDAAEPGKLKFTAFGQTEVTVKDCNLDGTTANLANQNNPVFAKTSMANNDGRCNQLTPATVNASVGVTSIGGKPCYAIKFNNRNAGLSATYNRYSPANAVVYDFEKILPQNAGGVLELIENARNRFEISVVDNVDNIITVSSPAIPAPNALMAGNCFVDTDNLGDAATIEEVMNSWKQKNARIEAYGIFRNPTPAGNKPYMFMTVRDAAGNVTVAKMPLIILHTLFRPNVINVETRRSE